MIERIGDVKGTCSNCKWTGTVNEAIPDVDGDGSLGCPDCMSIVMFIGMSKDEQIAALRERVEKLEKVQVIAESVNQWLIQNELGNTAHQLQLAKALQEAQ